MSLSEVREGARGVDVRIAQQLLNDAAHKRPGLAPDGVCGPLTVDAVRGFQRRHALDVDGVVGPRTWSALSAAVHPSAPRLISHPAAGSSPAVTATAAPRTTAAAAAPQVSLASKASPAPGPAPGRTPPELQALSTAAEPAWLKVAMAEYGIHERTALGSQRIIQYHQATSLHAKSDQVAWCSSFVNWCLAQVGIVGSRSAAAASWADWGLGLTTPRVGCIVQLHHHVKGYTSATGTASGNHVAFFIRQDAAHISLLGGNQSDSVKLSAFPLSKWSVKAYRWPAGGR